MPRKNVVVMHSEQPFLTAYRHNASLASYRETRDAAPHWHMLAAVGPFGCAEEALRFAHAMVQYRGHALDGWRAHVRHHAAAAGMPVYMDTAAPPLASLAAMLAAHQAPAAYGALAHAWHAAVARAGL